jgi:hypothetical protein
MKDFKKASSWRALKITLTGLILFSFTFFIDILTNKVPGVFYFIFWLLGTIGIIYGNITIFIKDE